MESENNFPESVATLLSQMEKAKITKECLEQAVIDWNSFRKHPRKEKNSIVGRKISDNKKYYLHATKGWKRDRS